MLHLALSIVLSSLSAHAALQSSAELARLIPPSAEVVAITTDLDRIRAELATNRWWKLAQDPVFAECWAELGALDDKASSELDGVRPLEVLRSVHGSVAVFVDLDSELEPVSCGLLVAPGAPRDAFDAFRAKLVERIQREVGSAREAIDGVDVLIVRPEEGQDDEGEHVAMFDSAGATVIMLAQSRQSLVALSGDLIRRSRQPGASPSVADSPKWLQARTIQGGASQVEIFVDLDAIWSSDKVQADSDEDKVEQLLGHRGIGWLHAAGNVGAGEMLDFSVAFDLPERGALRETFDCFRPANRTLLTFVPRDVTYATAASFDVARFWDLVWKSVETVSPGGRRQARVMLDQLGAQLEADIERDFVQQLTGDFASFAMAVPEDEWRAATATAEALGLDGMLENLPRHGEATLIGLEDSLAVEAFFDAVIRFVGMAESVDTETVGAHRMSSIEAPFGSVWWSFQDEYLVVSKFRSVLLAALAQREQRATSSVLDHPRFKAHFDTNRQASAISVASSADTVDALGMVAAMFSTASHVGNLDAEALLETLSSGSASESWPGADVIRSYLSGSLIAVLQNHGSAFQIAFRAR